MALADSERRILLIEDEPDVAASFVSLLEALGHRARAVHDGRAALAAVAAFRPDTVFTDIRLPGMDGHEIGRRLRQRHPQLRVIALTGTEPDWDRDTGGGFDGFILKPVSLQAIERVLAPLQ